MAALSSIAARDGYPMTLPIFGLGHSLGSKLQVQRCLSHSSTLNSACGGVEPPRIISSGLGLMSTMPPQRSPAPIAALASPQVLLTSVDGPLVRYAGHALVAFNNATATDSVKLVVRCAALPPESGSSANPPQSLAAPSIDHSAAHVRARMAWVRFKVPLILLPAGEICS